MKREDFIERYSKKMHLGDGLYVNFDGYHIVLSTERESGNHWVGLEPSVFKNLLEYRKNLYEDAENIGKE
jgi:hypothetical protein